MQGSETKWRQLRQSQQQPESLYESEGGEDTDVPASQLADKDSLFVQCNGLSIHYKQAYPVQVSTLASQTWQVIQPCACCILLASLSQGCHHYQENF